MTTGTVTGVNVHQFVLGLGIMTEDAYDAANIPGESGCPVFNQQGCVIGIADAVTATGASPAASASAATITLVLRNIFTHSFQNSTRNSRFE